MEDIAVHRALCARIPEFDFATAYITDVIQVMNGTSATVQDFAKIHVVLGVESLTFPSDYADPFSEVTRRKGSRPKPIDWLPLITFQIHDRPFIDTVRIIATVCGLQYRIDGRIVRLFMDDSAERKQDAQSPRGDSLKAAPQGRGDDIVPGSPSVVST